MTCPTIFTGFAKGSIGNVKRFKKALTTDYNYEFTNDVKDQLFKLTQDVAVYAYHIRPHVNKLLKNPNEDPTPNDNLHFKDNPTVSILEIVQILKHFTLKSINN